MCPSENKIMNSFKKKTSFILGILFVSFCTLQAQDKIQFVYDAAGNQISRTIVLKTKRALEPVETNQEIFQEKLGKSKIKIYPNPVRTALTVAVVGFNSKMQGELNLYDVNGSILMKEKIVSSQTILDMQNIFTGNYVLHITLEGVKTVWKIIKE